MLKVAIIGFGNLGQFLAKTLINQGCIVLVHSICECDHFKLAQDLGISYFSDPHDLCEQNPQVILLCTSIISTEFILKCLPLQRLRHGTLFVDMLPVKEFAKELLLKMLPSYLDIVCTHPMFEVESSNHGWNEILFMYEKVRIGSGGLKISLCNKFLNVLEKEGCRLTEISCAEYDKHVATAQFTTYTVGKVLGALKLESTVINTKGYETLLGLVESTAGHSFELYYELFMYNRNTLETLERLDLAFDSLKKQLFEYLHDVVRKQMLGNTEKVRTLHEDCTVSCPAQNEAALVSSKVMRSQMIDQPQTSNRFHEDSWLKIAIVGFGNFGQFLAKTIVRQGHKVLAYSRSDYYDVAQKLGVSYFSDVEKFCKQHPDVIIFCTSILSTDKVLRSLPVQRLMGNTLFVDVLSVKEFPRHLFLQKLPLDFGILCTHPMFGPESGKNGWNGLPFVYDKVRIGSSESRVSLCVEKGIILNQRSFIFGVVTADCMGSLITEDDRESSLTLCDRFLDIFALEGCRMVEMSCAEHDKHAAGSQFITHTIGRVLEKLSLESTPIITNCYRTLLKLVENTAGDSFDLYYGLFMYNVNAMEQLNKLDMAFESLKEQLFGRLHGVLRKQHFENADTSRVRQENHCW